MSEIDKGPLWVIPGTHHIYDKYSSCVGLNVQWPTPNFGSGSGFITEQNDKIPKTHLLSNKDKVIMFNHNIVHGSGGNTIDTEILRRAIGMTVLCVDRNNTKIMDKIYRLFSSFNLLHNGGLIYKYCEKNSPDWIRHFYIYTEDIRYNTNKISTFINSEDGTDKNAINKDLNTNRWKFYLDHIRATRNELINNNLFNTYIDSVKLLKNNANNDDDVKGL